MSIEEEINDLREKLKYHARQYYDLDDPKISDYEYDVMMNRLKALENERPDLTVDSSPTQKVGGIANRSAGALVRHNVPMLSLRDVFSKEEVIAFVEDMKKTLKDPEFVIEYKIDGLSMTLRYEEGRLVLAETRGDGIEFGEDVTSNALMIDDVVTLLQDPIEYFEIRGEVYMTHESFEKVNKNQERLGKKLFANPRNCAAGSLRQLDPNIVKERDLSLYIFNLQQSRGREFTTHTECYEYMKSQGIKVIDNIKTATTADGVWQAICDIGNMRSQLGYDIDGAVVKINNYKDREALGETSKVPRWAIAYKYPPEEKETILTDVELTVGRTGRINPTAIFNPIRLCGTTVSRATLHNQDFIDELDIGIGDTIVVYKSGEIIPKIKEVVKSKRPKGTSTYKIPSVCPVCGAKTVRDKDSSNIVCTSYTCPAQLENHIINFVARDAMDIKGFGEAYIIELIREGYIKDIADIYTLYEHRDELVDKGILGKEKNTDKLLLVINKSKSNDASMLLTGLGISGIGKGAAKNLIKHFNSIDNLMNAGVSEIMETEDIGPVSAQSIYEYFHNDKNISIIRRLQKLGVNMAGNTKVAFGVLLNKSFVITGTLPTMSRKDVANLIEDNGGKVQGSVSKKTDFLVAGDNAGSKLSKANELGVRVITEEELLDMIK